MIDCFALLQEPRRPWLDPEALKQKFLALSAQLHPDRVHHASEAEKSEAQRRFAELNSSYQRLRDPKERLQHLLELELGAKPQQVQRIPPELMDVSMEVAGLCRQADAFIVEKGRTSSPLLLVQIFERGQEWAGKLTGLQRQIQCRQGALEAELKRLDAEWEAVENQRGPGRRDTLPRLEELWRLFGFCGRWSAQLQERIVRLSF
jgi:curved DNA-binding protein CbpA